MNRLAVEARASSANLGPGFDVFALALDSPKDRVELSSAASAKPSVEIEQIGGPPVPLSPSKNGAGAVCQAMAKDRGVKAKISLFITKGVPIGEGLGSSGASAAAAAVAMNNLFNLGLSQNELIYYAGKGEEATSGTPHYDNVSASLLGGFVVVQCLEMPSAVRFDAPRGLALCVATPEVRLPGRKTEYSRSILPREVRLKTMVSNVANASLMVSGFARGDIGLIGRGMSDSAIEETRKQFIPGYDAVRKSAIEAGAEGVCISGAGPSVLAVADRKQALPEDILRAMVSAFRKAHVVSRGFVTRVGEGARVV